MPNQNALSNALELLNDNQVAIAAAVEELALWVRQRRSENVANNVCSALDALDRNAKSLKTAIESLKANPTLF
jgi:deoxyxylulose-5-phosphate synthase